MAIPTQKHLIAPLLKELLRAGGSARPKDMYGAVASHFPTMSEQERQEEYEKSGWNKFTNSVQWARQRLVDSGDIDNTTYGTWSLTEQGKQRAIQLDDQIPSIKPTSPREDDIPDASPSARSTDSLSLVTLLQEHDHELRENIQNILFGIDPIFFEELCGRLLRSMGFRNVVVTQASGDGGIDGYGDLRLGIVSVHAAFQCKRWKNPVTRNSIDEFRGATQGNYDQAIFMTTSRFTAGAQEVSIRSGGIPIIMIDGNAIVDLMIEHGIGVSSKPLQIPIIDEEYFVKEKEEE